MSLLTAYLIGSPPLQVGVTLKSWSAAELGGNEPFKSEASVSAGYSDVSSIENWDEYGLNAVNDYQAVRDEIKLLVAGSPSPWTGFTDAEKDVVIKYFAYDNDTDKVTYLMGKGMSLADTKAFLLDAWHGHFQREVASCQSRWTCTVKETLKYLSRTDAADLFETVEKLVNYYLSTGRLGVNYGDLVDGIMDYVESSNGFTGIGLKYNNYDIGSPPNWPELISALKDILVFGKYDKNDLI